MVEAMRDSEDVMAKRRAEIQRMKDQVCCLFYFSIVFYCPFWYFKKATGGNEYKLYQCTFFGALIETRSDLLYPSLKLLIQRDFTQTIDQLICHNVRIDSLVG